ncbi:uncharacterized protein LOC132310241 [Cornus florida]|uniref:uncharacterized protein LOC132310241 n=1 Tax=Cornus florida TaxID=4283 RepID=UPI0028A0BD2D|nr:uncharacterized protein LOC132310241 [Cornus florida]
MEIHATPFPGKSRPLKSKTNRRITEAPKINAREPPIHRQKRIFGTIRNPNVPAKTATEKPKTKPSIGISQKQPKLAQTTANVETKSAEKKSPEKNRAEPKKKSVCFQQNVVENPAKVSPEGGTVGPQTPVRSPCLIKTRGSGTPYHSAEKCSKCRFDRLETSSYWLAQIKLAESVGKHFVSAAFFRLAFESKAEPIRSLRVELKRYMARHEYLSTELEWTEVSRSYGLIRDESNAEGVVDSGGVKGGKSDAAGSAVDQEHEDLKEQPLEQSEAEKD